MVVRSASAESKRPYARTVREQAGVAKGMPVTGSLRQSRTPQPSGRSLLRAASLTARPQMLWDPNHRDIGSRPLRDGMDVTVATLETEEKVAAKKEEVALLLKKAMAVPGLNLGEVPKVLVTEPDPEQSCPSTPSSNQAARCTWTADGRRTPRPAAAPGGAIANAAAPLIS